MDGIAARQPGDMLPIYDTRAQLPRRRSHKRGCGLGLDALRGGHEPRYHARQDGCEFSARCVECPRPRCRYDDAEFLAVERARRAAARGMGAGI